MTTEPTRPTDNAPPVWRKLWSLRQAMLATLTPDERAEAAAYQEARRQSRAAAGVIRREEKRQQRLEISEMCMSGATPTEISAKTGLAVSTLRKSRQFWAIPIAARKGFRRLFPWLPDDLVATLDAIAADAGMDRQRALKAILKASLADGGHIARRELGVKRKAIAA